MVREGRRDGTAQPSERRRPSSEGREGCAAGIVSQLAVEMEALFLLCVDPRNEYKARIPSLPPCG